MKTDNSLKRATVQIAVGVFCFSLLMQVVYAILAVALPSLSYAWQFPVGGLFMAVIMIINFYLMGRGIYRAVDSGEETMAKKQIQLSHMTRSIMVVLALIACFLFDTSAGIAACITVAFPQLTVLCTRMFHREEDAHSGEQTEEKREAAPSGETPVAQEGETREQGRETREDAASETSGKEDPPGEETDHD